MHEQTHTIVSLSLLVVYGLPSKAIAPLSLRAHIQVGSPGLYFLNNRLLVPLLEAFVLLPLPRIPAQLATNAVNPVLATPPLRLDTSEREATRADGHVVAWLELDTLAPVEACPATGPRVVRHS